MESGELPATRVGIGTDRHRLATGLPLLLGGVEIASSHGPVAHSDGDVILHALSDAMLGAAAAGDIGTLFPDTDPRWKGLASRHIIVEVLETIAKLGWKPGNIDVIVHLEQPKISEHRDAIRSSLAKMLGISIDRVGVKAKTGEGFGPVGQSLAIEAMAVVQLVSAEER